MFATNSSSRSLVPLKYYCPNKIQTVVRSTRFFCCRSHKLKNKCWTPIKTHHLQEIGQEPFASWIPQKTRTTKKHGCTNVQKRFLNSWPVFKDTRTMTPIIPDVLYMGVFYNTELTSTVDEGYIKVNLNQHIFRLWLVKQPGVNQLQLRSRVRCFMRLCSNHRHWGYLQWWRRGLKRCRHKRPIQLLQGSPSRIRSIWIHIW